jgi:FKBP-type peptidyl-prolyl cis-trans isomerase 2
MYFQQAKVNPGPFVTLALLLCAVNIWADESTPNTIGPGKIVSISYTVTLPDGEVVHTNTDGYPIKYKQGDGKLLPALEAALAGLTAGDQKSVTLSPEDVYGPVNPAAFREVPIEHIPEDAREAGAVFSPPDDRRTIRVVEVKEDTALVDLNHPLAGKTLTYNVTILSVE